MVISYETTCRVLDLPLRETIWLKIRNGKSKSEFDGKLYTSLTLVLRSCMKLDQHRKHGGTPVNFDIIRAINTNSPKKCVCSPFWTSEMPSRCICVIHHACISCVWKLKQEFQLCVYESIKDHEVSSFAEKGGVRINRISHFVRISCAKSKIHIWLGRAWASPKLALQKCVHCLFACSHLPKIWICTRVSSHVWWKGCC